MYLNCNNNGQRLVDFAAAKNMVVSSTCFPHKEIHKQTWRSPDGKTNNQTDHILIDKRNASSMLHMKSCRGVSSDSDHYFVGGRYRCKIANNKYELNRTRRFHTDTLREASMVTRFQQQFEEEFGKLQTEQATKEESQIIGRMETVKRGYKGSSRTNNRIPTKTRRERMVRR
jgi:acid phosphatase class B